MLLVCLFICVLVGLAFLGDPWIPTAQTLVVPGRSVADLEGPIRSLLSHIAGSQVTHSAPGVFMLVVRRSPSWIWLAVLLTLPFGLLLLTLKQSEALQVVLRDQDGGTEIRIVGRTKESVVKTLAKALGSLDARLAIVNQTG